MITQAAFNLIEGHNKPGTQIQMPGGEVLTLEACAGGLRLVHADGTPWSTVLTSPMLVLAFVKAYPNTTVQI